MGTRRERRQVLASRAPEHGANRKAFGWHGVRQRLTRSRIVAAEPRLDFDALAKELAGGSPGARRCAAWAWGWASPCSEFSA
jgi:hypothetical protein